jgi:release factor glutamine methyltransferase
VFLKHKAGTLRAALTRVSGELAASGCESPRVDAELIVAHALGLSRAELSVALDRQLERPEVEAIRALVERRCRREPLQYVLGEWGFRRLVLAVDRRALIPRPETEVVVERCLALLAGRDRPRVLDVGTGSGAIALAIADEHPGARVTGIDVSPDALVLARENAERTGLAMELARHDLADGLPPGPWELVVSNPPYVEPSERGSLAPEVRDWEPALALYGRDESEAIARGALGVLAENGALALEVGDGKAGEVAGLLDRLGYRRVRVTRDLAGRERVVEGMRP